MSKPQAPALPLKRSFPPVVDARTRLLLLGSLPGEESLRQARYYANPRNQFWRLVEALIGADLASMDYERRLEALLEAGIGLWDVVASASRLGSLDGAIRGHSVNDLRALAESLPQLRAVGFNGGTSARIGMKELQGLSGVALVPLPSSSPALTMRFERKLERWSAMNPYLAGRSSV